MHAIHESPTGLKMTFPRLLRFGVDFRKLNNPIGVQTDKNNKKKHNFLTSHSIWLIIKLGQDLMAKDIFTKFDDDRVKIIQVREQTFLIMFDSKL